MLLDNAPSHPPVNSLDQDIIKTEYFPPNTTSILQPMDQPPRYYAPATAENDSCAAGVMESNFSSTIAESDSLRLESGSTSVVTDSPVLKISYENLMTQVRQLTDFENSKTDALVDWIDDGDTEHVVVPNNFEIIRMVRGTEGDNEDNVDDTQSNESFNSYDFQQAAVILSARTILDLQLAQK